MPIANIRYWSTFAMGTEQVRIEATPTGLIEGFFLRVLYEFLSVFCPMCLSILGMSVVLYPAWILGQ